MAKLRTDPIASSDMVEYLDSQSDFAFELRILEWLTSNGYKCEHSGSYDDPVTGRPRQFDIRAFRLHGITTLRLAIECKNIGENYPLLISCMPRRGEEAFHEVAFSNAPSAELIRERAGWSDAKPNQLFVDTIRPSGNQGIYGVGEPVGKSCSQVGRTPNGELSCDDREVFEKWSQAIASAGDLARLAYGDGRLMRRGYALSLVLPIVVVPNGRLWVVHFDEAGARVSPPAATDRCSFFVDRPCPVQDFRPYTISHLEFVTQDGLAKLLEVITADSPYGSAAFASRLALQRYPNAARW